MIFYEMEKDRNYPDVWYSGKDELNPFVTVMCPVFPGHQRGERDMNMNLSIVIKKPKLGDFVSTVFSDWLITDHTAAIFKANGLTGYELHPVNVCNKELGFNLWELVVTGSAGKAHPDSGIRVSAYCEYCDSTEYTPIIPGVGLIVDENRWDGSDFFTTAEYYKFVMVTERVKKVIDDNKLKGVKLILPSEIK